MFFSVHYLYLFYWFSCHLLYLIPKITMVLEKTTKELEAVFDCVGACVCVFDVLA